MAAPPSRILVTSPAKRERVISTSRDSIIRRVREHLLRDLTKQAWVEDYDFSERECEKIVARLLRPLRNLLFPEENPNFPENWGPTIDAEDSKRIAALRKAVRQLEQTLGAIEDNPGTKTAVEYELLISATSEPEAKALSYIRPSLSHLDLVAERLLKDFHGRKRPRGAPPKTSQHQLIRDLAAILKVRVKQPTELARCVAEVVRLIRISATSKRIQNILGTPIKSRTS